MRHLVPVTELRQNSEADIQLILSRMEILMFSVAAAAFFHKEEIQIALGHLFWKLSYLQVSVLSFPFHREESVLFSAYYFLVPTYHSLFFNKPSLSTS